MSNILISKPDARLSGEVILPGSKSESNRALIMQALCEERVEIRNLSEAADTVTLQALLDGRDRNQVLDVGPAGTAMRFLTAFCAVTEGEWTLTGSKRMKERPIGILADALRQLGADIQYLEEEGFPPMRIRGKRLDKASEVRIPGNISSQYISALLMIAPALPNGLSIHLSGTIGSRPYIEMTLAMMGELGIRHEWTGNTIHVGAQRYQPAVLSIEPDWSGASYWYSMAALCEEADLTLPYLKQQSLQGDREITKIMEAFGVRTHFSAGGIRLSRGETAAGAWESAEIGTGAGETAARGIAAGETVARESASGEREIDFIHCPDLAQTVISCCTALRQNAVFTGLESLKIKETDRVEALQNELGKFGARLIENAEGNRWELDTSGVFIPEAAPVIHTYHDHRMAMALAPLAIRLGPMEIEDKEVVVKSYPTFWKDLDKHGFKMAAAQINT
ncbi:3-phosphoshikimate 1-carboxyvinyltransferase [Anseongella ginsenosidimutans]|uniref:3-phosphoshikimate 1-carboxyvinyltransferase n=1 Tax=Anseongella ginsenosidimutans TaxID=496056 RepID=A0A4R3KM36_9SPHI|nr:3-phosphoshikimate 1-carboxyvinyltransferase [Anseongella ginsenosidimutans]QEC52513.1 3-phosphoshikimate 1-carboxyvinyltransferase [Anseongella ginsenosidimutans]TCS85305.1 3-phosphoshikimate 1-carboxyvinyltransferase [Anseongella ginsenosidimutans]